jgi:uncharacterized protein (DUF1778 family)
LTDQVNYSIFPVQKKSVQSFGENIMATARIDMRLEEAIKLKAEKASALLGYKSLTEYVVRLMDERSTEVIAQHKSIVVDNDVFDMFWNACNKTIKPNKALADANQFAKEHGFK